MELKLTRNHQKSAYTIGRLYVDGVLFSNTLEDPVRDYSDPNYKVYGKTAIPYGRYRVTMVTSPKFSKRYGGRKVPLLNDVPDFTGILIHSGNTAEDTDGCILVGQNTQRGRVTSSLATLYNLLDILDKVPSDEQIWIDIVAK
nr:MAG TPA: Protein of unknown function (DUF2778) [Caudoviricetes sp.]